MARRVSWSVIDFFSGCGGMSCGFARRSPFTLIAAVDAEKAKPCEGSGTLGCNETYQENIGIVPFERDIATIDPAEFFDEVANRSGTRLRRGGLTVFLCCPPCTDFSRAKPTNHLVDSEKNSLVVKCADFVDVFLPEFVVMENARELIRGNHPHHYREFERRLRKLGYEVRGEVHFLSQFGLPQVRERALVVASRVSDLKTLGDLWAGYAVDPLALTVRHAIGSLPSITAGEPNVADPMHQCPGFGDDVVRRRIAAVPSDGGSWFDLGEHPERDALLTNAMKGRFNAQDFGSHPDVYGRLAWDKPAITIKRECAHVGNGRYSHPEQTRLLTVREMALLQGFPRDYRFVSKSLANRYRQIGDAVPPLISYQLSALVCWMKTGMRPKLDDWILPGTSLRRVDVRSKPFAPVQSVLFQT